MMDVSILYAGLSAVTGVELITPSEAAARNITSAPVSIDKVFEYTHNQGGSSFQDFLQHQPSEDGELITPSKAAARNITSAPVSIDKVFEYTHNQGGSSFQDFLQHQPSEDGELITPSKAAARNITSKPIAAHKQGALSFQHFLQQPPSEDSKLEEDVKKSHSAEIDQLLKEAESEIMVEKKLNELKVATHKFESEDSESEEDTGRNPSAKTKKRRGRQLQLLSEGIELKERSHPAKTKQKCDHKRGIKDKVTIEDTSDDTSNEWININVETITSQVIKIRIRKSYTIAQVKESIEREDKTLPAARQKLFFKRKKLSDKVKVESIGIKDGDTLSLMMSLRGGGPGDDGSPIVLDDDFRDPSFDYDFTRQRDDGKVYIRGGEEYKRPYGWHRFAMKVLDKYGDNTWLGGIGTRTASTPGEWPVSYHGTTKDGGQGIISDGRYKIGGGDVYGKGIYSSPDLSHVECRYAKPFTSKGKKYKIVFQNRVNPAKLRKANQDQYWIVTDHSDIRPYGILLKEIGISVERAEPGTSNNQQYDYYSYCTIF